ncbi:MAG: hypothetical protein HOG49_07360 [Candidatus Scalindua sp.]|jgi:hypothetical protein|nr:hypothetical protein [Candidatus Scalindua sp.]
MAKITLKVESTNADLVDFKPFSTVYVPEKLFVEFDINDDLVVVNDADGITVTEDGIAEVLKRIAGFSTAALELSRFK